METDPKFCIDCHYMIALLPPRDNVILPWSEIECGHKRAIKNYPLFLVSGDREQLNRYTCNVMRGEHCFCGYEAKLFEPRLREVAA